MLIYSFDTKRNRKLLQNLDYEIFYFKKLKRDFEIFKNIVTSQRRDHIIGIAAFRTTQFESKAINQFNKSKKLSLNGKDSYDLFIPETDFRIHQSAYDSFCNWSSYKISEFIKEENLDTKVSFIHCDMVNSLQRIIANYS